MTWRLHMCPLRTERQRLGGGAPSASAGRRSWLWDTTGMFEAGSSERLRCWDNVHGPLVLIAAVL